MNMTIYVLHCFLGTNPEGKPVYLRDIWPTREEIQVEPPFLINFQKIDDTANTLDRKSVV